MNYVADFNKKGYVAPITVLTVSQATDYRFRLEVAEKKLGPLHYEQNIHTLLRSAFELTKTPALLDVVEQLIGPDIMLYASAYIIKEPGSESFVSWHQDLTYWGLSDPEKVVTGWLALSEASPESGCMKMIPGSHKWGQLQHEESECAQNVLYMGQTVKGLEDKKAEYCVLKPGQASLHHGWTLHSSLPNHSNDRRIGLNLQFIAPDVYHVSQKRLPALLLRGEDRYGYYKQELPAEGEADDKSLARHKEYTRIMTESFKSQHA